MNPFSPASTNKDNHLVTIQAASNVVNVPHHSPVPKEGQQRTVFSPNARVPYATVIFPAFLDYPSRSGGQPTNSSRTT